MARVKLTTFNTHLLETPTTDKEDYYGMEDDDRAKVLAQRIVNSGADVVALQEVWGSAEKKAIRSILEPTLPYLVMEVGDGDFAEQDSGLMLFSRFPFLPLTSHAYRPASLTAHTPTGSTSEVAFKEFDHGVGFDAALLQTMFGRETISDALTCKGIAAVIIDSPLGPLPIAFTHTWASYSNDTVCETLSKFDMRQVQLSSAVELLQAVVPPEWLPSAVFVGDLNITGNHHVPPVPDMPYGTYHLTEMCGTTPGLIAAGQIVDEISFQAALDPRIQALVPTKPGLLSFLFDLAKKLAAGQSLGCVWFPPQPLDAVSLRRSGAEWQRNIRGGPVGHQFDDGWSRLYGGVAQDIGTTADVGTYDPKSGERLDYVLVPRINPNGHYAPQYIPKWRVHHMTRAYNLLDGDAGIATEWGTLGVTQLSDHLGVNAHLAPADKYCSPDIARPVPSLPFSASYSVFDVDNYTWFRVELKQHVRINPHGSKVSLYHTAQMSFPMPPRRSRDPEVTQYVVPKGTYFLRVLPGPGTTGSSIDITEPDGARMQDALTTNPCKLEKFSMTPGVAHGPADEVWFKLETEPLDDHDLQQITIVVKPLVPHRHFLRHYEINVVTPDRRELVKMKKDPGGYFIGTFSHLAQAHPDVYVVVARRDIQSPGFEFSWTTDLMVFGAMELHILETSPGAGDDEIQIKVTAGLEVITKGTGPFGTSPPLGGPGFADVGVFDTDSDDNPSSPKGIGAGHFLHGRAFGRAKKFRIDLQEDDVGDVVGPANEVFDPAYLSGQELGVWEPAKSIVIDLRYRDGDEYNGHYQLKGWLARSSWQLPYRGSPV